MKEDRADQRPAGSNNEPPDS